MAFEATPAFPQSYARVTDKMIARTAIVATERITGYQSDIFDGRAYDDGCVRFANPEDALRPWVDTELTLQPLICQGAVEAAAGLDMTRSIWTSFRR